MNETPTLRTSWQRILIVFGVIFFLLALLISAIYVPELRLLHFLQELIYISILIFIKKKSGWVFGAGVFIAVVWNCLNLFITHLFQTGLTLLFTWVRTGQVQRPDTLMVAVGGIGHFLLIAGCLATFIQFHPRKKQWIQFFAGGLLGIIYLALIIILAAPR